MSNKIEVVCRETDISNITEYGLSLNGQAPDRWYRGQLTLIGSDDRGVTILVNAAFTVPWPNQPTV